MTPVVVIGAGIAGLVCAAELTRAGQSVILLEAELEVGGRVRSTVQHGCVIDHGFQVLFTAYPMLTSYLDLRALDLRAFRPAAHVVTDKRASLIGDALRDPTLLPHAILPGVIPLSDKLRLLALRQFAKGLAVEECFHTRYTSVSTRAFLVGRGFRAATIDGFFAPFYGGILLDRTLSTNAAILLFTFKMLAEGDTAVPARGMGAIARQLAGALPSGTVRTGVGVRAIRMREQEAHGVVLNDGSIIDASGVVLATDAPAAAALALTAGVTVNAGTVAVGSTSLYFTSPTAALPGKSLWLNAEANAVISHAVTLTEVAPEYAPGESLLVATAVGPAANLSDEALEAATRRELSHMSSIASPTMQPALNRVAVWRVPFSQFAQPPGFVPAPAAVATDVRGLWRASELLHSSSLEGAARGGRAAALALLAARAV